MTFTLLALACRTAAATNAIHLLDSRRDYPLPAGSSGVAVAAADLNNDGIDDVLTVTSRGVAVLLSEKGGTSYSGPRVYPAGNDPVAIATADFNGDGNVDVATANYRGNDVTVLLGAGDGTLGAPVHISAGSGPVALAAADVNHDGRPDLVVADVKGNQIAILYGNGDGTFQPPVMFSAGSQPAALALGDFNSDGRLDIAVVSQTGTITVLLGDGNGGFTPVTGSPSGASLVSSITAADFNGDGFMDIAVADQGNAAGAVYVCFGNGDGTFQAPTAIALPQYAPALASGDLNGDGHPDLVVVLSNQTAQFINALAVLLNDGTGNFGAPGLYGSPETPVSIATADLNHDGKIDVIVGCLPDIYSKRAYVSVVLGRGTGSLAEAQELAAGSYPLVAVADVNGDGFADLVVADKGNLWVGLGNGKGGFAKQPPIRSRGQPESLAVADVNGDGILDVIVEAFDGRSNLLSVHLGKGGGKFGPAQSVPAIVNEGFAVGDLNGDGYADVVMSAAFSNSLQVYWGSAAGTFTTGPVLNTRYAPATEPQSIVIADFNGDGRPDITISTMDEGTYNSYIEVLPGQGNGTFGDGLLTAVPVNGVIALADMNGDGLPDLVLSGLNNNTLQDSTGVLLSNGDGTFHAGNFLTSPYWTGAVAVADFNGDGHPDVVVLPLGQQLVTFTGDGHGNLTAGPIYGAGAGAWTNLVTGDFLNNGKPGLAFGNSVAATVGVVQNVSR
jgi:hypothetical protein